jgi:hypothetical protein
MSRDIPANALAEAQGPHVAFIYLVDFDFASGHVYLNSSNRDYSYNGHTYTAAYGIGGISEVKESIGLSPDTVTFTLPGVNPSLLTTTLAENYHGRSVVVYVAYVSDDHEIIATPFTLWEGSMDKMGISVDEAKADITLACENRLVLWNKSSGWLYTSDHQRSIWGAGDNFFGQIAPSIESILVWLNKGVGAGYVRNPSVVTDRY